MVKIAKIPMLGFLLALVSTFVVVIGVKDIYDKKSPLERYVAASRAGLDSIASLYRSATGKQQEIDAAVLRFLPEEVDRSINGYNICYVSSAALDPNWILLENALNSLTHTGYLAQYVQGPLLVFSKTWTYASIFTRMSEEQKKAVLRYTRQENWVCDGEEYYLQEAPGKKDKITKRAILGEIFPRGNKSLIHWICDTDDLATKHKVHLSDRYDYIKLLGGMIEVFLYLMPLDSDKLSLAFRFYSRYQCLIEKVYGAKEGRAPEAQAKDVEDDAYKTGAQLLYAIYERVNAVSKEALEAKDVGGIQIARQPMALPPKDKLEDLQTLFEDAISRYDTSTTAIAYSKGIRAGGTPRPGS